MKKNTIGVILHALTFGGALYLFHKTKQAMKTQEDFNALEQDSNKQITAAGNRIAGLVETVKELQIGNADLLQQLKDAQANGGLTADQEEALFQAFADQNQKLHQLSNQVQNLPADNGSTSTDASGNAGTNDGSTSSNTDTTTGTGTTDAGNGPAGSAGGPSFEQGGEDAGTDGTASGTENI